jgi:hypothetical protein
LHALVVLRVGAAGWRQLFEWPNYLRDFEVQDNNKNTVEAVPIELRVEQPEIMGLPSPYRNRFTATCRIQIPVRLIKLMISGALID